MNLLRANSVRAMKRWTWFCQVSVPRSALLHADHSDGGGQGAAIAAVDGTPGIGPGDAFFADMAVAQQLGIGAKQPVIMQGLDHGDASFGGGFMDGGRQQGEEIVDVDDVGLGAGDQCLGPGPAGGGIGRVEEGAEFVAARCNGVVGHLLDGDGMARLRQQCRLGADHGILAAGLLIGIMQDEDVHDGSGMGCAAAALDDLATGTNEVRNSRVMNTKEMKNRFSIRIMTIM